MKSLSSKLLLSISMILLPISVSQLLEHRLWKDYGQVIYDYSRYNRHGCNGQSNKSDSADCLFTDRGVYLDSSCKINMHAFLFTNPISIYIWAISDDTMTAGRLFCRWSTTRKLQVFRNNTFSGVTAKFQGPNLGQSIDGNNNFWFASNYYLDVWVLIAIEINKNILTVYKNFDTILQFIDSSDYYDDSIPPTFHLGNDKIDKIGFGGFVWYIAIYDETNKASRYLSATSSSNCFIGICSSCNPSFIMPEIGTGCGPNSVSTFSDSSGITCLSGYGCRGINPIKCICPSQICEFTSSSKCFCINNSTSYLTKYEAACSCTPLGQGCCKPECASCSDELACLTCKDGYSSVINGQCVCIDGYISDQTQTVLSCIKCNIKCKTCSSQNYCTLCLDSLALISNGDCICPDSYFADFSASSFTCSKCLSECKTCEDSSSCLACKDENAILSNTLPQKCVCKDGYFAQYLNGSFLNCTKCDTSCSLCKDLNECMECAQENTVIKNGICVCADGFYEDNSQCLICKLPCLTCSSSINCLKCKSEESIIFNGTCKCMNNTSYFDYKSGLCINCPTPCLTCNSTTNCFDCLPNSTLTSRNICECNKGFHLDTYCKPNPFKATLTMSQDLDATIWFSSNLKQELLRAQVKVWLDQVEVSFKLQNIDLDRVRIRFEASNFKKSMKLKVEFSNDVFSEIGTKLVFSQVEIKFKVPDRFISRDEDFKEAEYVSGIGAKGALSGVIIALGLGMMQGNFKSFFDFMNMAEIFYVVYLMDLGLHVILEEFLLSIRIPKKLPKISKYFLDDRYGTSIDSKSKSFGYKSSILLLNTEAYIETLLIFLALFSIISLVSLIKIFQAKLVEIISLFKYSIFIRFWIQSFLEFLICLRLGLKFVNFEDFSSNFNLSTCLVISVIFKKLIDAGMILLYLNLIRKRRKIVDFEEIKNFDKKFGTFFADLKKNCNKSQFYYGIFILRRVFIVISMEFEGLAQLILPLVLNFVVICI